MIVTRFAPSPTGHLHLGHVYSAFYAAQAAKREKGRFLLRIEDIDPVRCRPEFSVDLIEDLRWLGLEWDPNIRRQSQHIDEYATILVKLRLRGLVYPCFCTRREVAAEAADAGQAPHLTAQGPDGPIYPGTCRNMSSDERALKLRQQGTANWRLDVARALAVAGDLSWNDRARGKIEARPQDFGDIVLARKDVPTSYHLSVTVDDHLQGVNLVTRGEDLFRATDIHRLLQGLLGYATPEYHHHPLKTDAAGRRYAKRDKSVTIRSLRAAGKTPAQVLALAGVSI